MYLYSDMIELRNQISKYNKEYYIDQDPSISDEEYDELFQKLKAMEEYFKEPDVSQKIGSNATSSFKKYNHVTKMLSLDNVFNENELMDKIHSFGKKYKHAISWSIEHKYDGLSLNLIYKDGLLYKALVRGDGEIGEDVTANALHVNGVNKKLSLPLDVEIRGEVIMFKNQFALLNSKCKMVGSKPFVNPRNAASGSLRQHDPNVTKERGLTFIAYSVVELDNKKYPTLTDVYAWLKSENFTPAIQHVCSDLTEIKTYIKDLEDKRYLFEYDIDGLVFKPNVVKQKNDLQKLFPDTARYPNHSFAYKFKSQVAKTTLIKINYYTGRTGLVTPVATIEPVVLSGATISAVTLHNAKFMDDLNLHEKDVLEVTRSAEVIPKVIKAYRNPLEPNQKPVLFIDHCPCCNAKLTVDPESKMAKCPNSTECSSQIVNTFVHFCSNKAFNIVGMSIKTIESLRKKGYLKQWADFFTLTKEQLLTLDGFSDKKADNLLKAISDAKEVKLANFIYSLGIPQVGSTVAQELANNCKTLNNFLNFNKHNFYNKPQIGLLTVCFIAMFFNDRSKMDKVHELVKHINVKDQVDATLMSVAITGSHPKYTRRELSAHFGKLGMIVSDINKQTSKLYVGENPGSSLNFAVKNKIPVFNLLDIEI